MHRPAAVKPRNRTAGEYTADELQGSLKIFDVDFSTGNGKLEPPKSDAKARASYLSYMLISETELTAGVTDYFWHAIQNPEDQRKPQIAERGKARWASAPRSIPHRAETYQNSMWR